MDKGTKGSSLKYNETASSTLAGASKLLVMQRWCKYSPKVSSRQVVLCCNCAVTSGGNAVEILCKQSTAGCTGNRYRTSGTPAGHRAFRLGRIRWVFHWRRASSKLLCRTCMKQKRIKSVSRTCPGWKAFPSTNDWNKSIHHCEWLRLKKFHQLSIRWFPGDVPYTWAVADWTAADCMAEIMTFSVPQSVLTEDGYPPTALTHDTK